VEGFIGTQIRELEEKMSGKAGPDGKKEHPGTPNQAIVRTDMDQTKYLYKAKIDHESILYDPKDCSMN
jgi:hypothetical protein